MTIQAQILATVRRLGRVKLAAIRAALPSVNYNTLRGAMRRLRDQGLATLENGVYEAVEAAEAPAPINPAAVMRAAWKDYHTAEYECTRKALAKGFLPQRLANCIRYAWADAKRARRDAMATPADKAARVAARILILENKTRWDSNDWDEMSSLRQQQRQLGRQIEMQFGDAA